MTYSSGRVVHDADAHIMETPTWLRDHADPDVRDRIAPLRYPGGSELRQTGDPDDQLRDLTASFEGLRTRHQSDEYRRVEAAEIMQRKNFAATGSFIREDRPRALDLLGFSSQLVFNTFHNRRLRDWEHRDDLDLAYGAARAHNRGMIEFCSVDRRLAADVLRAVGGLRPGRGGRRRIDRHGRGRASRRLGMSSAPFAEPHRSRPGLGPRAGGRDSGRVPRRGNRRPHRVQLLPQRAPGAAGLPRW